MKKIIYILIAFYFLLSCTENKETDDMQSTHVKLPECDSKILTKLNDPGTELSEYAQVIKANYTTCWLSPEEWKAIIEDPRFSEAHRVNALYGLILRRFKPGMNLNSFLGLIDKTGAYGIKENFRLCRNPLFFENRKPGDTFVMCNPLGNVCVKDSIGVSHCYGFTLQISSGSGKWASHINEDNPQAHQKMKIDGLFLSGIGWELLIEN